MHKLITTKISEIIESSNLYNDLTNLIKNRKKIFLVGVGRSGLVTKMFAMRLMHLGIETYVVGDVTTPAIHEKDLLIAISGSGETKSVLNICEKAKNVNSTIACITQNRNSTLANNFSHHVFEIYTPLEIPACLPLGSAFELSTLIYLECVIANLMEHYNIDENKMKLRHANLE